MRYFNLLVVFLMLFNACSQEAKNPMADFDIDGDEKKDIITSRYIEKGCHFLHINLSSQPIEIVGTPYQVYFGYPHSGFGDYEKYEKRKQKLIDDVVKLKDFDNDGKAEVYAEIFKCGNGMGYYDEIPNYLQELGITTHYLIMEYENDSLIEYSIPLYISPEQYFHSQNVNWNQELLLKEENGQVGYVDKNDDWIILPTLESGFDFKYNITRVTWQGIDVLINKKGEIVNEFGGVAAPHSYNGIFLEYDFDENGLMLVEDGFYHFLDTTGSWYKEKLFYSAELFSEGLSVIKVDSDSLYGYMNTNLDWEIPAKFDDAYSFKNGKAKVVYKGKQYYLYKDGTMKPIKK